MANTLLNIFNDGETHILVSCAKCGRQRSYNIERLLSSFVELSPKSFLEKVTACCERCIANNPLDPCAAIYGGFTNHARS